MKSDPIYLSQVLTCEASLGVFSVAGNVCSRSVLDVSKNINVLLLKLVFVLECLGDFTSLCEVEEERFGSIDEVLT